MNPLADFIGDGSRRFLCEYVNYVALAGSDAGCPGETTRLNDLVDGTLGAVSRPRTAFPGVPAPSRRFT